MLDDIRVEPPYAADNCVGSDADAVARLKLVVSRSCAAVLARTCLRARRLKIVLRVCVGGASVCVRVCATLQIEQHRKRIMG